MSDCTHDVCHRPAHGYFGCQRRRHAAPDAASDTANVIIDAHDVQVDPYRFGTHWDHNQEVANDYPRLPRPAGLQQVPLKLAGHVIRVSDLTDLEEEIMEQVRWSAEKYGRMSGLPLPAEITGTFVLAAGIDVWRTVQSLVDKQLLHISDRGHFVSTTGDLEPRRPARVDLVMNQATANRAWSRYYKANPTPRKAKQQRQPLFTIERNGVVIA
jgi:hypothetical protein